MKSSAQTDLVTQPNEPTGDDLLDDQARLTGDQAQV